MRFWSALNADSRQTRIVLGEHCIPRDGVLGISYTSAALTALIDIIFAALSLIFTIQTALPRGVKLFVGGILMLGSLWVYLVPRPTTPADIPSLSAAAAY